MIEIKKVEDVSEKDFDNKLEAFALTDDGIPVMYCAYKLEKDRLVIHDIKGDLEDKLFLDAVIRTVASYAKGRGATAALCRNKRLFRALEDLKFVHEYGCVTAGLDLLLRHNCCEEV